MTSPLLDCHCHLDRYEEPDEVAAESAARNVFVVAVTHLPSHFKIGVPHVRHLTKVRLAIGLHPLAASEHARERDLFVRCLQMSSFVGEVGLDFSRSGVSTRLTQLETFRFVAKHVAGLPKVVSLHSRGAEKAVLDVLLEFGVRHAVFHWYTGAMGILDEAVRAGHFFSVNPAMVDSAKGRRVVERIPPHQLLTETDGPYAGCEGRRAKPWDVAHVGRGLSAIWSIPIEEVHDRVWQNFCRMLALLRIKRAEQ